MANIVEETVWRDNIYEVARIDYIIGGPEGVHNRQAKNLADRTQWLRDKLAEVEIKIQQTSSSEEITTDITQYITTNFYSKNESDSKYIQKDQIKTINGISLLGVGDISISQQQNNSYNIPVGTISFFATAQPPEGWFKANGDQVSRTVYSELFSKIGTMYGVGDGSKTFNLPDLRGEFIRGFDDGRGVDSNRILGSSQNDEIKQHTHNLIGGGADSVEDFATNPHYFTLGGYNHSESVWSNRISATGGSETRPRNIALLVCIKY